MAQGEEMTSELRVLDYLKKEGPTNTFRIASSLEIDRALLLDVLKKLEASGALNVKSGMVYFIEYPQEKKEAPELKVIQTELKIRNEKPKIVKTLQFENKQLKEKLTTLGGALKELEKKTNAPPKVITRTIIKNTPPKIITRTNIKKVPVIKLRKQTSKKFPSLKQLFKKTFAHKKQKKVGRKTKSPQKKVKTAVKNKKFKFPRFKLMERIKKLRRK